MEIITIKKRERERERKRGMLFGSILRVLGDTCGFDRRGQQVTPRRPNKKRIIYKSPQKEPSVYIYICECEVPRWKPTSFFPELEYIYIYIQIGSHQHRAPRFHQTLLCVSIDVCLLLLKLKEDQKEKRENSGVKEPRKEGALCAFV